MKKHLYSLLILPALTLTNAQAEIVKSGSKYPVVVEVYEGSSKCNPNENSLTQSVTGVVQTYKKTKGSAWQKFTQSLSQSINATMKGSGCDLVGQGISIAPSKSINLPVGSLIVAYKDPVEAWNKHNKVVNPLPTLCFIEAGKSITLETRKSEGLRSFIGFAGDGGLKCSKQ